MVCKGGTGGGIKGPTSKTKVGEGTDALFELSGLSNDLQDAIFKASIVGVGVVEMKVGWQGLVLI